MHQVDILTFLLFIATSPKHLIGVDKIKNNPKSFSSRPQWQQNSDLLIVINLWNNFSKLLALIYKVFFKCKKFNILDYKAHFIFRVISRSFLVRILLVILRLPWYSVRVFVFSEFSELFDWIFRSTFIFWFFFGII